jgi:HSP20 family protein
MNNDEVVVRREHATQPPVAEEEYRVPAADVYETSEAFVLMLDLPGAMRESISLTLENGEMRVKADVKPLHRQEGTLLFNEMQGAGFFRAFSIGDGIDTGNVDARFEQGVLTVKLFKGEDVKPREIYIN